MLADRDLLYRALGSVKVGQVERFIVKYKPPNIKFKTKNGSEYFAVDQSSIFLKVKNCEPLPKRAAYLMGPYILYVDVRSNEYSPSKNCFISADQPSFDPNLQANQVFASELSCHTIKDEYVWVVDIISQTLFSSQVEVNFEILLSRSESYQFSSSDALETGVFDSTCIHVDRLDTDALWSLPPRFPEKPVHLVILTHGLHSNLTADMLYLKETIESISAIENSEDNIVVRGFKHNVCKTERGIKYLGMKVADYIINEAMEEIPNVQRISFVGHSLGGLIQTFAIAYIAKNYTSFFDRVEPINFVTLASPLLGISHIESPSYVHAALNLGALGRTGQELGLVPTEINGTKALLELLPTGITKTVLKKFQHRTLYANIMNDGIVPLRTSALLFLDYKGLKEVAQLTKIESVVEKKPNTPDNSLIGRLHNIPFSMVPFFNSASESDSKGASEANSDDSHPDNAVGGINPKLNDVSNANGSFGVLPGFMLPIQNAISSWVLPQGSNSQDDNSMPRPSVIDSAKAILIPPMPSKQYFVDPDIRKDPIVHDKTYTLHDTKQYKVTANLSFEAQMNPFAETLSMANNEKLEEEIAVKWHEDTTWRKILVNIEPDAHNNILVRRRFSNAYGWLVIDHLVKEHFGEKSKKTLSNVSECEINPKVDKAAESHTEVLHEPENVHFHTPNSEASDDALIQHLDEILAKDDLLREHSKLNYTPMIFELEDSEWINSKNYNEDSLFEIGPTGFLSSVNDKISKLI